MSLFSVRPATEMAILFVRSYVAHCVEFHGAVRNSARDQVAVTTFWSQRKIFRTRDQPAATSFKSFFKKKTFKAFKKLKGRRYITKFDDKSSSMMVNDDPR